MAGNYDFPTPGTSRLNRGYLVLLLIGVVLRLWQFLSDTSLWIDEIAVAHDVLTHSAWALLTSPLSDQVAPKGFLLAVKFSVWIWGPTDSAFRIYSLASSLASLFLFWRIALRLEAAAGPLAFALFASAIPLVTFGSEAKQYSGDVFITVLLLWLTLRIVGKPRLSLRERWVAAFVGLLAAWFSHAGDLVMVALAAALFWILRRTPTRRGALTPILGLWIITAAAAAGTATVSIPPGVRGYVRQVWAQGFMPLSLRGVLATLWPWDQMRALVGTGLQASLDFPAPAFFGALILVGFWRIWRLQYELALCLLAPVAITLGVAVVQQYPFSDRLILFLVPIFLLALGAGIDGVRVSMSIRSRSFLFRGLGWALYGALGCAALSPIVRMPPPYHVEDMKPVLSYLRAQRRPGDRIYSYYGAAPATAYYAARYGLRDDDYAVGGCHRGDGRRYLQELDNFRGSPRVWVILTHSLPEFHEREDILRYLNAIGKQRLVFAVPPRTLDNRGFPAEVYLFDLSDSATLAQATASTFDILGPLSSEAGSRCLYGPQVMIPQRGI